MLVTKVCYYSVMGIVRLRYQIVFSKFVVERYSEYNLC